MNLSEPLIAGNLCQRYKRFFVDVELHDGSVITAHCPNSGSMTGLLKKGNPVLLSKSSNPKRKLPLTWELVQIADCWVGVNTLNANRLIYEALVNKQIVELVAYNEIKKEPVWDNNCRFDFLLKKENNFCYLEVKNVTLTQGNVALFPDAKTERGTKHLNHLIKVVKQGMRAVMCFLVHRDDCVRFTPACNIDPLYSETLQMAFQQGVEILVYRTHINPPEVRVDCALEFEL